MLRLAKPDLAQVLPHLLVGRHFLQVQGTTSQQRVGNGSTRSKSEASVRLGLINDREDDFENRARDEASTM